MSCRERLTLVLNFSDKRTVLVIILGRNTVLSQAHRSFRILLVRLCNRCARLELSGGETQKQRDGIAGSEVGWPPEWQWFVCCMPESGVVGHQSGSDLRAVFYNRLWTTVVRATSPITLHRRREGSHRSLPILAVVNLSIPTVV